MKERPILMSGPMVNAILEGRKTQTRRVVKASAGRQAVWLTQELLHSAKSAVLATVEDLLGVQLEHPKGGPLGWVNCPYGKPGDRLWVRESFATVEYPHAGQVRSDVVYRADDCQIARDIEAWTHRKIVWTPSIHMPRIDSRITLEITNVRVERLQDIDELDALAEGIVGESVVEGTMHLSGGRQQTGEWVVGSSRDGFRNLWNKINGKKHPWSSNPWCWVVEFKRVDA